MSLSDTTPKYSFPTTTGRCETRNISISVRTLEPFSSSVTVGMDSVIKFSAITIIALFCYRIRIKVVNCTQNQYFENYDTFKRKYKQNSNTAKYPSGKYTKC